MLRTLRTCGYILFVLATCQLTTHRITCTCYRPISCTKLTNFHALPLQPSSCNPYSVTAGSRSFKGPLYTPSPTSTLNNAHAIPLPSAPALEDEWKFRMKRSFTMDVEANCAICSAPPRMNCLCENERLQLALKQAEQRTIERQLLTIRDWVLIHARQHVLNAFERLKTIRKQAQNAYLKSLPYYDVYMQYSGAPPISPHYIQQLQMQIREANAEFRRGVDLDWRASVLRYPEVLDYFYGLVELKYPEESSPSVSRPPFALAGYEDRGYTASEISRSGTTKKKKKLRDAVSDIHSMAGHLARIPPPPAVPMPPPIQHGGYHYSSSAPYI